MRHGSRRKGSHLGINVPLAFRCTAVGVEQHANGEQLYLSEVQRGLPEDVGPD